MMQELKTLCLGRITITLHKEKAHFILKKREVFSDLPAIQFIGESTNPSKYWISRSYILYQSSSLVFVFQEMVEVVEERRLSSQ